VGHGTRDESGLAEFMETARAVASQWSPGVLEPCFLEMARPTVAEGLARLAQRGARRVAVVPLLLFAAGHAKRDIPAAVADAAAAFPDLAIRHADVLGCREPILALSQRRFEEALAGRPSTAANRTLLIMVGRGSFDAEATAEMERFSQVRAARTPVARVLTCFIAMQRPSLAETLESIPRADYARIVVQPHLLFSGQLLTEIRATVGRFQSGHEINGGRKPEWVVAPHLGPAAELVAAVLDLARSRA